jgi:two-component system, chemotaxis family, protein-glutamate methylesterase/glutaminase
VTVATTGLLAQTLALPHPRLIVIGASLGGVAALKQFCSGLPRNFKAPICVVLHTGAQKSMLPDILNAAGPLRAMHAVDGAALEMGRIYIAPPDHHMRVDGNSLRLARGPKEHHSRPAIDPLFRSAALSWQRRVIGVVLTGLLEDGTPGMQAIKACGGTAIVQDPVEAMAPSMPLSVVRHVDVDHCVRLSELAPLLCSLLETASVDESQRETSMPSPTLHEEAISLGLGNAMEHLRAIGSPSTFTCPDCHGSLWEVAGTSPRRFRCHTGHAFTFETLRETQSQATDEALWSSIRALQEKRELSLQAEQLAIAAADLVTAAVRRAEAARLQLAIDSLRQLVEGVDA